MGISEIYASEFRKHIKHYYPNWRPDERREVGDYGILTGDVFEKAGNIKELGITFSVNEIDINSRESFGSEAKYEFNSMVNLEMKSVSNLNITIDFSGSSLLHFTSKNSKRFEITSMIELNHQVLQKFRANKWKQKYVIITSMTESFNTIIAVSENTNSRISFGCDAKDALELNNLKVGFRLESMTNGVYSFYTEEGKSIIPMFKLAQLKGTFRPELEVLRGSSNNSVMEEEGVSDKYSLEELE